ncbi:MAG: LPS export ABC transporter permease LptG [Pseudomonadota bacterium]
MKQLDAYVARTVGLTILLAVVGLVGILSIFTFLEQVEDIEKNYDIFAVLWFCLFSLPRIFYEIAPFAALIGCLAGLGLLASNSELLVMRSSGVSTWAISWSALKPALVLVLVSLLVGEYVLPDVERMARNERTKALSADNQITPYFGMWYREGNVFMHFDEMTQAGVIGGLSHYYMNGAKEIDRSLYAERAVFHDVRPDEKYWLMENVVLTDIYPDRTEVRKLASLEWRTGLEPDLLKTELLVRPDKMSIAELRAKIDYMEAQSLNSSKFQVGYWQKILQPLATLSLVLVAVSFIFGPLREATMGMRVVAGVVIGILFKFVQDLLAPASLVFGFPPVLAILVPVSLCLVIGLVLMRRAN